MQGPEALRVSAEAHWRCAKNWVSQTKESLGGVPIRRIIVVFGSIWGPPGLGKLPTDPI